MKFWNLKHNQKPEKSPEQIENLKRIERFEYVEPQKAKKEFKLKVGMKYPEIYQELHNNVSGETSEEIQVFYTDMSELQAKNRIVQINRMFGDGKVGYDSHKVILSDNNYAIIEKNSVTTSGGSVRKRKPEYYIAGINDEDMYFVHPVANWRGQLSIKNILDYINRTDEGFTERLQGDILLQFKPYKVGSNRIELGKRRRIYGFEDDELIAAYPNPTNRTAPPSDDLTIELGRHTLLVKNTAKTYTTNDGTYVVVESDSIEIMHPEHKKTVREIPKGHYAILANQRGRREPQRFD